MSSTTAEQSVGDRAVYLLALVGVFVAGITYPLLGLAVALVLDRTLFRSAPHWGSQLVRMGLCTQLFWVGLLVISFF